MSCGLLEVFRDVFWGIVRGVGKCDDALMSLYDKRVVYPSSHPKRAPLEPEAYINFFKGKCQKNFSISFV